MEWVEVRAENITAAEELALDQLGVAREDAEFEVVTREENRLFGLKKTEARVRARVRPVDIPTKKTNNQRKRKKNSGNPGKETAKNNNQKPKKNNKNKQSKHTKKPQKDFEDREPMPQKEQEDVVIEFLEGVVKKFDVDASVCIRMEEERIIGAVDGSDIGLLIGPKAGTLLALQDITRTVVQRHAAGRKTNRLSVDVGGYREKRKASLVAFTAKQAEIVKETGKALPLEPMGSADRKIIHDAVAEIEGISSSSDGEEPRRRVVLQPE